MPSAAARLLRALAGAPAETAKRWLRRAACELDFARAFAEIRPAAETAGWDDLLTEAGDVLERLDGDGGLLELEAAVRHIERLLEPIGRAAKAYTIHCVGHGHIDMNWMWSWPETVATTHDTFASVLSLMEQYPDVTYSQSQASVYALMERYYPAMFAEIQRRVKEGRWEVAAVHWVEGDKNIASGESLCRHLLYTRRYFQEKFGLSAKDLPLDWEPDTFGHANTVPGILAQGGVKYYYSCRTGGGFDHARIGGERPPLFWWQGPDGSRVLVNRETTWYNSYVNIGENVALPLVKFCKTTGLKDWLNVYGIGNHGGGPTRVEIDYYKEMQEWPVYPKLIFGTAKAWFDLAASQLPADLPVLDHELNFEFTGCYTSQSLIKQANRFGENYLEEAETLAAVTARLGGAPYPTALLGDAWKNVLFNQFHDILPGSGVRQTREHALGLFQEVGAITGSIKRSAGKALAASIDTLALLPDTADGRAEHDLAAAGKANTPFVAGSGIGAMESGYSHGSGGGVRFRPYVVYNPCAWTRSEPVTVDLYDTDFDPARVVALDESGASHPTLFLGKGSDWGHQKITVLFLAKDVPALGYRTFLFCEGRADVSLPAVTAGPNETFETDYLKLGFDRYRSGLTDVWRKSDVALLNDPHWAATLGGWQKVVERPRGMTAWALGGVVEPPTDLLSTSYGVQGVAHNEGTAAATGSAFACRVVQNLEVPGTKSTVKLTTLIHGLEPRIDVTAEVDWREIGDGKSIPGLTVHFPLHVEYSSVRSLYETPFGSVERCLTDGEEVPTLRYAHIAGIGHSHSDDDSEDDKPVPFTLLQDCKYGHSLDGANLTLRIVRSSTDPDHAPEVNRQTVRYSMYFHETEPDPATLARLGAAWNHPLIAFPAGIGAGDGKTPPSRSFARVETENVVLTALKQAEDGDGLVLRLAELNGAAAEAVVVLDPALAAGLTTATVTDVMEEPLEGGTGAPAWDAAASTLRVPVRAHSFVTVRLR